MRYYLIVGEPSGDLHGSNLMRGLKNVDPEAEFRFWGGDRMAEVGGKENLVKHYKQTSFFGITNVVRNLPTILQQIAVCKADIANFGADAVILIDYPSFNMRIAKWAHNRGIRVIYYIPPKVWAWKEYRVKAMRRYIDRLYAIFPFEQEWFAKRGITPVFKGNPLCDAIADRRDNMPSREEFIAQNGLDSRPIVALLAGSRRTEIRNNLPDMVALAKRFPNYQFVVTGVSWLDKSIYDKIIDNSGVKYVCDKTYETLNVAEAAIVTSGTATLETALIGIPEMVVYHVPKIYELLKPYVLKIPYISLVNINLGYEAVREIVCKHVDMEAASAELASILKGGSKREEMLKQFDELRELIGGVGSSQRSADDMVEYLKGGKQ